MSAPPPFGALAPSAREEAWRRRAGLLPENYWGRRLASLLLGPAGGREGTAKDGTIFGGARVRLHPHDNISEKRVYLTPQFWDAAERIRLEAAIAARAGETFWFMDVGANAGLYSLFALAAARRAGATLRALAVEPDPVMGARLAFNAAASEAGDAIALFPYAAAGADGPLRLAVNEKSRGLSALDAQGALAVEGRTLLRMLTDSGAPRLDALKIDIEGAERPALEAFFRDAPRALWPRLLIAEIAHEGEEKPLSRLIAEAGYRAEFATKRNLVAAL